MIHQPNGVLALNKLHSQKLQVLKISYQTQEQLVCQDPRQCDVEVTIADGNKVRATHVGHIEIHFISDKGTPSTLLLANVYYVPGLSRRLFSLQLFTRDTPFSIEITHHYTRLHFGDGETYTWPIV